MCQKSYQFFAFCRSFNVALADDSLKIPEEDFNEVIKLAKADYSSSKSVESLKKLFRWPKGSSTHAFGQSRANLIAESFIYYPQKIYSLFWISFALLCATKRHAAHYLRQTFSPSSLAASPIHLQTN